MTQNDNNILFSVHLADHPLCVNEILESEQEIAGRPCNPNVGRARVQKLLQMEYLEIARWDRVIKPVDPDAPAAKQHTQARRRGYHTALYRLTEKGLRHVRLHINLTRATLRRLAERKR